MIKLYIQVEETKIIPRDHKTETTEDWGVLFSWKESNITLDLKLKWDGTLKRYIHLCAQSKGRSALERLKKFQAFEKRHNYPVTEETHVCGNGFKEYMLHGYSRPEARLTGV